MFNLLDAAALTWQELDKSSSMAKSIVKLLLNASSNPSSGV
jgi:hypothetical protein